MFCWNWTEPDASGTPPGAKGVITATVFPSSAALAVVAVQVTPEVTEAEKMNGPPVKSITEL
jgi:hypothetical protein